MNTSVSGWFTVFIVSFLIFAGCRHSMVISRVDYSQSIESVLKPNEQGIVTDVRNGLSFNILPLQYAETRDTSSVTTRRIRYIRGREGYYYITASGYRHVYVMAPEKGKLRLKNKLKIAKSGLETPAFNQQTAYIQLLNQKTGETWKVKPGSIKKSEPEIAKKEEG